MEQFPDHDSACSTANVRDRKAIRQRAALGHAMSEGGASVIHALVSGCGYSRVNFSS